MRAVDDDLWHTCLEPGDLRLAAFECIRQERLGLTYALRPELAQLRPPTLFLWGDKDTFGPPALGMELAALAPNARCVVVQDAGHLPFWDQPELCAQLMLYLQASQPLPL